MTGITLQTQCRPSVLMAAAAVFWLAGCDENGEFAFPGAQDAETPVLAANAPGQTSLTERDVERPDIFEVNDRGLWDGRPSLGGVWVAHPDAQDPERVVIRNDANGRSIIGALFRRERENPGPLLQVSSDAAEELGILPGAPTQLTVVALRREEIAVPAPSEVATNPVVSNLAAPVSVAATPLDPVAPAEAAAPAAEDGQTATEPVDVSGVVTAPAAAAPAAPAPAPAADSGIFGQVGTFSVEANANGAAQTIRAGGLGAVVRSQQLGGRTVWRVLAGPLAAASDLDKLKQLGFSDAFIVRR